MNIREVKEFIERIDMHYNTDHSKDEKYIKEWFKELKKYDKEDVERMLEEHLKSNFSNVPPKLYYLIKDLKTPEQKIKMENIITNCTNCGKKLKLIDFDTHMDRCLKVSFIKRNVKEYLNQEINEEDYFNMSEVDIQKRWEKIANIVINKTDNERLKNSIIKALGID